MKICENGICREMTQAEVSSLEAVLSEDSAAEQTVEERIAELEEALALLLSGGVE